MTYPTFTSSVTIGLDGLEVGGDVFDRAVWVDGDLYFNSREAVDKLITALQQAAAVAFKEYTLVDGVVADVD